MAINRLTIEGEVVELMPLRYTPAGIPLLRFKLRHISDQIEADVNRKVGCEINAVVSGNAALKAEQMRTGVHVRLSGFLDKFSAKSTQLVLHVKELELRT